MATAWPVACGRTLPPPPRAPQPTPPPPLPHLHPRAPLQPRQEALISRQAGVGAARGVHDEHGTLQHKAWPGHGPDLGGDAQPLLRRVRRLGRGACSRLGRRGVVGRLQGSAAGGCGVGWVVWGGGWDSGVATCVLVCDLRPKCAPAGQAELPRQCSGFVHTAPSALTARTHSSWAHVAVARAAPGTWLTFSARSQASARARRRAQAGAPAPPQRP